MRVSLKTQHFSDLMRVVEKYAVCVCVRIPSENMVI